jgi:hypothetical protein
LCCLLLCSSLCCCLFVLVVVLLRTCSIYFVLFDTSACILPHISPYIKF